MHFIFHRLCQFFLFKLDTRKQESWLKYFTTWIIVVNIGLQWRVSAEISTYAMEDRCGKELNMAELRNYSLALTFLRSTSNFTGRSCDFAVATGYMWAEEVSWNRLMFQFLDFQNHGDGCISLRQILDRREWESATKTISGLNGSYCGTNKPPIGKTFITSKNNLLVIKFKADGFVDDSSVSFKLVINVLHSDGSCSEYKCDNGNCIPKGLRCGQYNPCGDNSHCRQELSVKTIIFIIIGVVAGLILVGFAVKYYRYKRKLNDDDTETDDRNLTPLRVMNNHLNGNQGQPTVDEDSAVEQRVLMGLPPPPTYKEIMSDQKR